MLSDLQFSPLIGYVRRNCQFCLLCLRWPRQVCLFQWFSSKYHKCSLDELKVPVGEGAGCTPNEGRLRLSSKIWVWAWRPSWGWHKNHIQNVREQTSKRSYKRTNSKQTDRLSIQANRTTMEANKQKKEYFRGKRNWNSFRLTQLPQNIAQLAHLQSSTGYIAGPCRYLISITCGGALKGLIDPSKSITGERGTGSRTMAGMACNMSYCALAATAAVTASPVPTSAGLKRGGCSRVPRTRTVNMPIG